MSEAEVLETGKAPSAGVLRARWVKAVGVSLVVGVFFFWLLRAGALPVLPPSDALGAVDWGLVWLYASAWVGIHLLRCSRWYLLLKPAGEVQFSRSLFIALAGYAALVVLPFRMGEAVRPALVARQRSVSLWGALGTVGAERIVDGVMLSLGLGVALLLVDTLDPLPTHLGRLPVPSAMVRAASGTAVVVFLGLFVCMWLFHLQRERSQRLVQRTLGKVWSRGAEFLIGVLSRLSEGLSFLSVPRYSLTFVAISIVYWVFNATSLLILFHAVGLSEATVLQAMVLLGVLGLGVAVPNAPGFFGSFQIAAYAALVMFFPEDVILQQGAVYVFLLYVIQIALTLLMGLIGYVAEEVMAARQSRLVVTAG